MKLKISEETRHHLILDALLDDYRFNLESLRELKAEKEEEGGLAYYRQEDLKSYRKLYKALRVVLKSYLLQDEYKALEKL